MRRSLIAITGLLVLGNSIGAKEVRRGDSAQLSEPFHRAYTGDDATGNYVIGLWQFDGEGKLQDSSGNGHTLQVKGARFSEEGRFGGAMESLRGWPEKDEPHQVFAKNSPKLTPKGAFTIEMWIKAKPELEGYGEAFLLDKKYADPTDYQLTLSAAKRPGERHLQMRLGFGEDTVEYNSEPFKCESGTWHHIAFTYDGGGTGRFFVNGMAMGSSTYTGRASIAAGKQNLVIGDRVGSYYHGFPGCIDQVRICNGVLEFRPATLERVSLRKVFVRMEKPASMTFAVTNRLRTPLRGATVDFTLSSMRGQEVMLPELQPGARHILEYNLDTGLRPDHYRLSATIEIPGDRPFSNIEEFNVTIVPRPLPHRMPVVMWGAGLGEVDRLKDLGFTHCIGIRADMSRIWEAGQPTEAVKPEDVPKAIADLDYALSQGIGAVASLSPGRWARDKKEFLRVALGGKPYPKEHDVCGLFPELRKFCYNVGASVAKTYGNHPAWQSALVHTEVRGESELCYHDHDKEAFRKFAGFDIPKGLLSMRGTSHQRIAGFPADRVIPDDYPMYVYYRWFWKEGDGWNALHTAVHDGVKSSGRKDLWTFHDPAVRVASAYGSGGKVDVLSHWTYSYPDPIRIGLCADELLCMAAGASRPDQQVMKMTQIIWYRNQTAPEPGETAKIQFADFADKDVRPRGTGSVAPSGRYQAGWERAIPEARFITIAPMHLREAFWAKIARPIKGIMYHGWQSLVDAPNSAGSYRYTHPETKNELRRLVKVVVEPLGPTLVQIGDRKSDVAFLESFASQMFARRGTYGWNSGWAGDVYLILMYAQLQPQVIYEETVQQKGLDQFNVLVMVDCDVLPRSVVEKVKAFQSRGGIIIGDAELSPAFQPDILLKRFERPKKADVARALLIASAKSLRSALDPRYQRHAWSTDPDVIPRERQYNSTDYLFAVNDLREFGDYVGHHGLVMENGLSVSAHLVVRRQKVHVYDLVAHREVEAGSNKDTTDIEAQFGPCDGKLYMITERAITGVHVEAPKTVRPGDSVTIQATVLGADGQPLDAIVPVRMDLLDPHGRPAEFSGFYGAKDGQVQITAHIAANDAPGLWRIHAEELASGKVADAYMRVTGR